MQYQLAVLPKKVFISVYTLDLNQEKLSLILLRGN